MTRFRPVATVVLAALMACQINIDLGSLSTAGSAPSSSDTGDSTGSTGSTGSTAGATEPTSGESTTSTGLCPSTAGTGDAMFPASCAEVLVGTPGAPDGEYTLHAANDPASPWQAWCLDMDSTPREYLILAMTGDDSNFSSYLPGIWPGTTVQTNYTRVRIDPYCFVVDISDQTFATSTGQLVHDSVVVTSMPYGAAMDCVNPNSMTGRANIDLRGTPFAVPGEPYTADGFAVNWEVVPSFGGQVVDLRAGGYCGSIRPILGPYVWAEPLNDWGGFDLPLVYAE